MGKAEIKLGILDYFGEIEDPRADQNRQYLLAEVLVIAFCSLLSGGTTFADNGDVRAGEGSVVLPQPSEPSKVMFRWWWP